jgi:hypothetical protein
MHPYASTGPAARLFVVMILAAGSSWAPSHAADPAERSELDSLRREFQALRMTYERRIAALEARLVALEEAAVTGDEAGRVSAAAEEELDDLRAAAREAAGSGQVPEGSETSVTGGPSSREAVVGHERNLNRLNPEISLSGDVLAFSESGDQDFDPREFELDFQATLDPFSRTKWTIAYAEEEIEIEEGYVEYSGLASGLGLRAGRMRQTFGAINRFHQHALPQVDYPLVLQAFFDEEGLAQTGISAEWLVPRPWASANELTLQVADGSSEAFGGDSFERLSVLGHVNNYWDLTSSVYLEWGLSGAVGKPEPRRQSRVWGTDVTYHWQPPAKAKYREITWRTEALFSQRDDTLGSRQTAWGGYSYVEGLLMRNLYAGLRYDRTEDPLAPRRKRWAVEPYATWWQSEYVRLRAAYRMLRDEGVRETDHSFLIQLTWAAGPHRHEAY